MLGAARFAPDSEIGSHRFSSQVVLSHNHQSLPYPGLFPGLVYYLTFWYPPSQRSLRVAIILASATLAGAFGGAIAFGVGHMNQVLGLSAWRWLFILEGIPSLLSSVAVFLWLPDYPATANWLSEEDKDIVVRRLKREGYAEDTGLSWRGLRELLWEGRLYVHYAVSSFDLDRSEEKALIEQIYFGISVPFSSLSLFTPSITAGLGYKDLEAQLMIVPPYAVACMPPASSHARSKKTRD